MWFNFSWKIILKREEVSWLRWNLNSNWLRSTVVLSYKQKAWWAYFNSVETLQWTTSCMLSNFLGRPNPAASSWCHQARNGRVFQIGISCAKLQRRNLDIFLFNGQQTTLMLHNFLIYEKVKTPQRRISQNQLICEDAESYI